MKPTQDPVTVLFLCSYAAPYGGNFIASLLALEEGLAARGVRAVYAFPEAARARDWFVRLCADGHTLVTLDLSRGFFSRLRALCALLDRFRAAVLHVHFAEFLTAECAALLRPRLARLVLHLHSDFSGGKAPGLLGRVKRAAKRVPELLVGKKRLRKIAVGAYMARAERGCVYIHNALAPRRLTDEAMGRAEMRARLGLAETDTLVLLFGWSPHVKGADLAANAVSALRAAGRTQFHLGLVCGREYPKTRMRAWLAENSRCAGDEPWLHLLPPEEDVFRYHKASDVFCSASRSEAFSYALLEALTEGRFAVAGDVPGVRWAAEFETVAFYPAPDEQALAAAIAAAAARRAEPGAQALLAAVSARTQKEYAIGPWVEGVIAAYGLPAR